MQYGICLNLAEALRAGELDKLAAVKSTGFTYVETNAAALSSASEAEIAAVRSALGRHGIACKCANVLFPGTMKIVGAEADMAEIGGYLSSVMPKLASIGAEILVLGSGGSRRVPDGFPRDEAFCQFCAAAKLAAETAGEYGIKIALEHLSPKETNLLTTVGEAVSAVRKIDRTNCGLVFDYYHIGHSTDEIAQVYEGRNVLLHTHIALPGSRLYPMPGDEEAVRPFFDMLKKCGYNGTVSVEANLRADKSFEENLAGAYALLTAGF
ncbi:MAG: sugar phosphate isomerase/epimerase [Oscillospiraceae bacterium]|nr:sugar phosphate isomerase/epimerase [Oscillospiraceae bacterium]